MSTLHSVPGNSQRLDGGAMFGNAPRALWERWVRPDDRHRIPLACRAALWRTEHATVLLEAGIGAFFRPELRDRYGVVESDHVLLDNLAAIGVYPSDIDVVVLSHLHFDHAGGLLTRYDPDQPSELVFPNARYLVGKTAWERALAPHPRDRASFVPELHALLTASGRLTLVDGPTHPSAPGGLRVHRSDGHTPGMMLTELPLRDGPMVFAADLIPGVPWVHAPITMGYDRFPERLIDEKTALLEELLSRGGRLFFTHDAEIAAARVVRDARGRFNVADAVHCPAEIVA